MGRIATSRVKRRLNLETSVEVRDELVSMRDETGADSLSEVIRRALSIYAFIIRQVRDGATVVIKKDGEERDLIFDAVVGETK